jgi:hypothetical protein
LAIKRKVTVLAGIAVVVGLTLGGMSPALAQRSPGYPSVDPGNFYPGPNCSGTWSTTSYGTVTTSPNNYAIFRQRNDANFTVRSANYGNGTRYYNAGFQDGDYNFWADISVTNRGATCTS